jgi:hypothetical protein
VPDSDGAVGRLECVADRLGKTCERPGVGPDVDRLPPRDDGEDAGVPARAAVRRDDGVPLPRAGNSGDPCFDPAERARICEVAAQLSWGSMSP